MSALQSTLTGSKARTSSINFDKSIFKSCSRIVLMIPRAARLTPRGSEEPVGFLPAAKTAQIVSILSAIPTIWPSTDLAVSLSALSGK